MQTLEDNEQSYFRKISEQLGPGVLQGLKEQMSEKFDIIIELLQGNEWENKAEIVIIVQVSRNARKRTKKIYLNL